MSKMITVSDYIVNFLIKKGVAHVFGYPGGMVTYLMDSLEKRKASISSHINYHEQASAFSACSYAQLTGIPGVAYATSGPGATNLITGIANAYYDSIPTIFLTGQVNTIQLKGDLNVRQKGFQEMDIVETVKPITKYSKQITNPNSIKFELEKAYKIALSGRPGPVLLDIPIDIQRGLIDAEEVPVFLDNEKSINESYVATEKFIELFSKSERPVIIAGNGISIGNARTEFSTFMDLLQIPIVTSMIGIDVYTGDKLLGFLGAYGHRAANFAIANADLVISLGSRLDIRQTGEIKDKFCPHAEVFRIDIDREELLNKVKLDEKSFAVDIKEFLYSVNVSAELKKVVQNKKFNHWIDWCLKVKRQLQYIDNQEGNDVIRKFSHIIPSNAIITTDVGQNQVWVAQSFNVQNGQRVLFTGGHAAMGYALPAAIGAYYSSPTKPIVCFTGDGGFQMNIQELQFIQREKLPIKIILFNNSSLGMIRHFQEMYFNSAYTKTKSGHGYENPDFSKIAHAYSINYKEIRNMKDIEGFDGRFFEDEEAWLVEVFLNEDTYVYPKLAMNKAFYDQEPLLDADLLQTLLQIK